MSQPGMPLNFTYPQNKIEDFVAEAYRNVNMVTLSSFPSAELRDRNSYDLTSSDAPPAPFYFSGPTDYVELSNNRFSMSGELQPPPTSNNELRRVLAEEPSQISTTNDDNTNFQVNRPFSDGNDYSPQDSSFFSSQQLGVNEGDVDNVRSTGPQYQPRPSQRTSYPQTLPSSQRHGAHEGAVDDIGINLQSTGPPYPQQSSQGPAFSQTLPPSQQLRANEGAMDDLRANVRSISPPYQQQFSQGSYSPPYSLTLPPSQQHRVNEDDFGANARSAGPPYQQQSSQGTTNPSLSQTLPSSSRQLGVVEGAIDEFGVSSPPYRQRQSQGSSNSSFYQTYPSSQQGRVNDGNFGPNVRPAAPPYEQQPSQTLPPSQQPSVVHSPHPQRVYQENVNSRFSQQTLPPSQHVRVNEGAVGRSGSPHPQQFSQGTAGSSFSQTLPPSQQIRVNEGGTVDNFGRNLNVRPATPPYEQQFSQTFPPIQQFNEGAVDASVHPPHPQQFSPENVNSSYSQQTSPPSQQRRVGEGAVGHNTRSSSPHPQQSSQGAASSSFSQTLPPSQQMRANESTSDNWSRNIRPAVPPYEQQQFSQILPPPSQQIRVNEGAVDDISSSVHPTQPQRFSLENGNSSFSQQTLPPSQQPRVNEDSNVRSNGLPHSQQFSQGTASSSFPRTLPPSQQAQARVNEGTSGNFGRNVRPAAPPYEQQFSQNLPPPSQQLRVNEGADDIISSSFNSSTAIF